jgi:hypothetical protein
MSLSQKGWQGYQYWLYFFSNALTYMRLDLVTLFPCQAVPMLQGLLRFDNGWDCLFFGASPHLRPEG